MEQAFIKDVNEDVHNAMVLCFVDGQAMGSGSIPTIHRIKLRRRAGNGISVLRNFWGQASAKC